MKMIFIHGAPGVGKYSVAKELADGKDFRLLHNHLTVNLVDAIIDFGSEEFWEEVVRLRMEMISLAIKNNVPNLIITQVIEKEDAPFIESLNKKIAATKSEIYFVRLICDLDEHLQRVSNPERKDLKKMTDSVKLRQQMENKQYDFPINSKYSFTIDNTLLSPQEVKDRILKLIV